MDNKIELRRFAKDLRKSLDVSGISRNITDNILSSDWYKKAENVMLFYPLADEVDLLSLISQEKNFYIPRVNGDNIEICPYNSGDELFISELGIMEPQTHEVNKSLIDIIFTPALMIDKNFYRLGYGGGYYDRLLNGYTGMKVGVVAEDLFVENLPVESYDVQLDCVVTEKKVY